jgi:hypothetical protein
VQRSDPFRASGGELRHARAREHLTELEAQVEEFIGENYGKGVLAYQRSRDRSMDLAPTAATRLPSCDAREGAQVKALKAARSSRARRSF